MRLTNCCVEFSVNPRVDPLIHNRVNYNAYGYTAEERAVMRQKMEQHKLLCTCCQLHILPLPDDSTFIKHLYYLF